MTYKNGEAFYVGRKTNGSPYIWNTFGGSFTRNVTSTLDNIMTFSKEGSTQTWAGTFIDMEKRITIPSGSLTLYIRMTSTSNTLIYYKPNSLPSCGVGSTTNSRAVSRRT